MSNYYNRVWELLIDDDTLIEVTTGRQFKMTFNVLVDFGGSISYADIAIYNLSESTANTAIVTGSKVGLRAGYTDTIDYIFSGRITNVLRERMGPNTITRIIARGGSAAATQSIEKTLGAGVKLPTILQELADAMGYPLVIQDTDFDSVPAYIRGKVLHGDPRQYLDDLANTHNLLYLIENDRLVIVADDSYRDGDPRVISEATGMEGIPEITEVGVDVNLRLSPKIKIGGRIDIQSELRTFNFSNLYFQDIPASAGTGIYRVYKIEHSGDTYGDAWTTKITGYR